MRLRGRNGTLAALVTVAALGALCLAPGASGSSSPDGCATLIADPAPGYIGGGEAGLYCEYEAGTPTKAWTVPAGIIEARFWVIGGNSASALGGNVRATLSVAPGETYELTSGPDGGTSSIGRSGVKLLVGGGGDGVDPNYAVPEARGVEQVVPGGPPTGSVSHGRIYASWDPGIEKDPNWKPPGACIVPRLTGKTPKAARAALADAGCAAGPVMRRRSRPKRRGLVIGQSVRPGLETRQGTEIPFTVGRRP